MVPILTVMDTRLVERLGDITAPVVVFTMNYELIHV
jgi:hypothetical protein